ncbi:MAG: TIGR01244 family phosphatase [Devosia nanyangense]|nr:TIGR01244 family phosphatase [Devosia nanyangense]
MLELKRINDTITVSGQILPEDVSALKAAGFTTIINNRPDGESPDQPASVQIEAAAKAAGLNYIAIPLGRDGVTPDMVEKTRAALEGSDGPVFAFCRSGTRSTTLWALSQAGEMDGADIIAQAAGAGYDMSHLAGHLTK